MLAAIVFLIGRGSLCQGSDTNGPDRLIESRRAQNAKKPAPLDRAPFPPFKLSESSTH